MPARAEGISPGAGGYSTSFGLQEKGFDPLVPGEPRLGMRLPGDRVAPDVVLHQQDRLAQRQPRDLHRLP